MGKQFGGKATEEHLKRYAASKNWDGNKFVNLEETTMKISFQALPKLLRKQFCEKEGREPATKIPITPFDNNAFLAPSATAQMIWHGHSAVLMRMSGKTMLIDPMLGSNAAPISPFAVSRFSENTLELINDFPEIDVLLLTHDHYDHLDYDSIMRLKPKVKKYFVALGVARHLVKWGINESDITEFDWWDHRTFGDIKITFTPSRHFSGRGLRDRAKSLWGGWVFRTDNENIWFSGDGGYGQHFRQIGDTLGPFDFALMECGQYNENWHLIHMYPEESVQAAADAKAKKIMPVHWAGFSLAQHQWTEPADRFVAEAQKLNIDYIMPRPGALFTRESINIERWWAS